MKNSARGSPIRSTSSRVTSTPLNGITTSRDQRRPRRRPRRRPSVHHAGAAGQPDREDQPVGVLLVDDQRPPEVEVVAARSAAEAVRLGQAVVVHQPDQVGAALRSPRRSPSWKPPAPPRFSGRACGARRFCTRQPLPRAVGSRRCRPPGSRRRRATSRSRSTRRCSRGRRLKVTTTATTARRTPYGDAGSALGVRCGHRRRADPAAGRRRPGDQPTLPVPRRPRGLREEPRRPGDRRPTTRPRC